MRSRKQKRQELTAKKSLYMTLPNKFVSLFVGVEPRGEKFYKWTTIFTFS